MHGREHDIGCQGVGEDTLHNKNGRRWEQGVAEQWRMVVRGSKLWGEAELLCKPLLPPG